MHVYKMETEVATDLYFNKLDNGKSITATEQC